MAKISGEFSNACRHTHTHILRVIFLDTMPKIKCTSEYIYIHDERKKNVIYKIPCKDCKLSYIGDVLQWYDERESQHRRCIRNQDENHRIFWHIIDTGHDIAWEKVVFLDFDQRTPCRKMKESFLIDIHASIDGVMNPRDGTQKDACWNSLITILKKS